MSSKVGIFKKISWTLRQITERRHLYLGWNGPSLRWAFICRKHKQMPLFFQRREGRKPQQTGWVCSVCVCVCVCTWKEETGKGSERESERERGQREIKAGGMFLNLCVGGEASPTQNALPHSLTAHSGFSGASLLFVFCTVMLPLHQSSPDILRESWSGDSARTGGPPLTCDTSPTRRSTRVSTALAL